MEVTKISQLQALARAAKLGRLLQDDHPEIALLRSGGLYYGEIVDELGIGATYGVSAQVARTAVRYAATGYPGTAAQARYRGLFSTAECREVKQTILARRDSEQSITAHAQRVSRVQSGCASAQARGLVPYASAEDERLAALCGDVYPPGTSKYAAIAQQLNAEFHGGVAVRTPNALKQRQYLR